MTTGSGQMIDDPAGGIVRLAHNRVRLALHRLAAGRPGAPSLLLLHGLGERAGPVPPASVSGALRMWPGPVWGLDFTGHGDSTVPTGAGYTAEALMGDADTALAHLGPCTVLGRGLGAYVALLVGGARPQLVRGAVLAHGPGLAGGGPAPGSPHIASPRLNAPDGESTPDPLALAELSRDLRPPDYAASFAWQAANLSELPVPITICVPPLIRPEWLAAVAAAPGVQELDLEEAVAFYAAQDPAGRH